MNSPEQSPLGRPQAYPQHYAPELLYPIARQPKRSELGLDTALPFYGADIWSAYELSWLDLRGKPEVALARFWIPADSPAIIESKSFKLYLNGFAQERYPDAEHLHAVLVRDLSAAAGARVAVKLDPVCAASWPVGELEGELIDTLELDVEHYGPPQADYLGVRPRAQEVEEWLVSHLLCSQCPVTGQPDWGSVQIGYRGPPIDRGGLLRYLVSFRTHREFHEQCVERIWRDIKRCCAPEMLHVYARYTRRGGLDINPFRSSEAGWEPPAVRTARQ